MRYIFFDTETTGMSFGRGDEHVADGHRVVELGCVEMIDRQLSGKTFHAYFNPERPVDPGALEVHHLDDRFLSEQPRFSEKLDEFFAFIEGADALVAHNAPFDVRFLNQELRLAGKEMDLGQKFQIIDTLPMARRQFPRQSASLDKLCERFNISLDKRQSEGHGALLDSELLALVYLRMTGGQSNFSFDSGAPHVEAVTVLPKEETCTWLAAALPEEDAALHERYMQNLNKS